MRTVRVSSPSKEKSKRERETVERCTVVRLFVRTCRCVCPHCHPTPEPPASSSGLSLSLSGLYCRVATTHQACPSAVSPVGRYDIYPTACLLFLFVREALPWVRCVYSTYSGTTNNHSLSLSVLHAGRVRRVMYTNDNNTSTPSSSLSAGAVAYPWIRPNRVQHDNTQYTLNLPLLVLCVFLY